MSRSVSVVTICFLSLVAASFVVISEPSLAQTPKVSPAELAKRLPRIPATEPKDALKTIRVAAGFSLEMVASEPLVADPVDACFDADDRMYVAEMHGYPYSLEKRPQQPTKIGKQDAGAIRLLEDTNSDGKFDKSTIFAKDISWPTSVCCYKGGVFVIAPPHIYYLKDTDGDNKADVREIVYSGFSRSNVQGLANNLKWGLDNRIYAAGGRNGAEVSHRGKKQFTLGRRDVRINPATEAIEPISGGLQFGHSMDDWGNRFVCSNSNHIQQVVYEERDLKRNPFYAAPATVRSIAREGGAGPVFRTSPPEPWRIVRQEWRAAKAGYRLVRNADGTWKFVAQGKPTGRPPEYPIGYFTSATGVTIYRGGAYPDAFQGNAFIGDVGANLVHRKTLTPSGATFVAQRADKGEEFITSSDNWFRPVNFVNAPDGTLYVLDMYRETIEHPFSVPEEIKAHLDLESGHDRGRIYRIVAPQMKRFRTIKMSKASSTDLVAQLESPNSWNRETAQRLLWERQDKSAAPLLRRLVSKSNSELARLHALWTLDGLDSLDADDLVVALNDKHAGVREHAVRLAASRADDSAPLLAALLKRADDDAYRVRLRLAFALGDIRNPTSTEALAGIVQTGTTDAALRTAVMTSVGKSSERLAVSLLQDETFRKRSDTGGIIAELALMTGTRPENEAATRLLTAVADPKLSAVLQRTTLSALGEGLARRGMTIGQIAANSPTPATRNRIAALFVTAAKTAKNEKENNTTRVSAAALLAFADYVLASPTLGSLLSPQTPQTVQIAAVSALSERTESQVGSLLLASWSRYSPTVRKEVVEAMLRRVERTNILLKAVGAGTLKRSEISRDKQQLLSNHPNDGVRATSRKLFGQTTGTRGKVVTAYRKSLDLKPSLVRGREVFRKRCISCHKLGNEGQQVGPVLSSVQNKSPDDMLIAILDPNREAQPNFMTYTVVTTEGKLLSGIISTETATSLTLRRAEGKQDVVLRNNIEILKSNGVSLMPEGLEKDITPEQMADLIAFVRSLKPAKPKK
jgi:putative membrane-bound dehydrogenase-like protein